MRRESNEEQFHYVIYEVVSLSFQLLFVAPEYIGLIQLILSIHYSSDDLFSIPSICGLLLLCAQILSSL